MIDSGFDLGSDRHGGAHREAIGFRWPRWRTSGSDWLLDSAFGLGSHGHGGARRAAIDSGFDLGSDRHGGAHREAIGCSILLSIWVPMATVAHIEKRLGDRF